MPIQSSLVSNFKAQSSHVEGCQIDICSNQKVLVSVGNDDALCIYSANQQNTAIHSISNKCKSTITAIAIHPFMNNEMVVGTSQGYVIKVSWNADQPELSFQNILYKSSNQENQQKRIKQIQFSENGKFIYIVACQNAAIIYNLSQGKFYKKQLKDQSEALRVIKDYKSCFFAYLDVNGSANIFRVQEVVHQQMQDQSQSEDPFASLTNPKPRQIQYNVIQIASYIIANQNLGKNNILNGSFSNQNNFLSQTLYLPGQTTLQKVEITLPPASVTCDYGLHALIHLQKQILHVCWLKNYSAIIVTSSQKELVFWHQKSAQKLININLEIFSLRLIKLAAEQWIRPSCWGLAFIAQKQGSFNGSIYQFVNNSALQEEVKKLNNTNTKNTFHQIQEQKQIKKDNYQKKKVEKRHDLHQESKAHKMLPVYPQVSLQTKFQQYNNAKFILYNNIGCIIQRTQENTLELQYHDKSHISRIKISSLQQYIYFALSKDTLVYASTNQIVVQNQKYLKQNNFYWQAYGKDIQGIAIGNEWIAVAFKQSIRIYDLVGNQICSAQFDRQYLSMAAYEDHLAIVYHSSLPMWGVMSLKMNIYSINRGSCKLMKTAIVPLKNNSSIKWFGFSEQGAIFVKDQHQNLRVYSYEKDEWTITLSLDSHNQKLFIQHIQNYQIYGFKLTQNPPQQPRVMPRSFPRKIMFDLGNYKVDNLTESQTNYVKQHKLKLLWIQHQKYRNKNWCKYKYSRNKSNPWFSRSQNIKSQEDIRVIQAQTDLKLLTYLKDYIKNHRQSQKSHTCFWQKILGLCQSLVIFPETRNKLRETLREHGLIGESMNEFVQMQNSEFNYQKKTKINQLNRLEELMSLNWSKNSVQKQIKEEIY